MLAEDLRLQKWQKKKKSLHITGRAKGKKREREGREKRNQDQISTPERELWESKGIRTLGGHLTDRATSWDRGGASRPQKKAHPAGLRRAKHKREPHRPLVLLPSAPQPVTLRRGLGTKTGFRGHFWGED